MHLFFLASILVFAVAAIPTDYPEVHSYNVTQHAHTLYRNEDSKYGDYEVSDYEDHESFSCDNVEDNVYLRKRNEGEEVLLRDANLIKRG